MRFLKIFSSIIFSALFLMVKSQSPQLHLLQSGNKISLRGLSVVDNKTIWASGNKGMVVRTVDGGKHFQWLRVEGYETRDFRDIEGFDKNTALIMAVAEPAIILKTIDGGQSWKKVFEDSTKGMFLDAMDFINNKTGYVIGDPVNGNAYIARTDDGGGHWMQISSPPVKLAEGEAFFASSGTNIKLHKGKNGVEWIFSTGAKKARLVRDYQVPIELPLVQGENSTGGNSIAVFHNKGVIVGGNFMKDTVQQGNSALFELGNNIQISQPNIGPHGYRSCVVYLNKNTLVSCGTSGIDISTDGGKNWELISRESYHVVQKAKKGKAVFLAGGNGKVAQLIF